MVNFKQEQFFDAVLEAIQMHEGGQDTVGVCIDKEGSILVRAIDDFSGDLINYFQAISAEDIPALFRFKDRWISKKLLANLAEEIFYPEILKRYEQWVEMVAEFDSRSFDGKIELAGSILRERVQQIAQSDDSVQGLCSYLMCSGSLLYSIVQGGGSSSEIQEQAKHLLIAFKSLLEEV